MNTLDIVSIIAIIIIVVIAIYLFYPNPTTQPFTPVATPQVIPKQIPKVHVLPFTLDENGKVVFDPDEQKVIANDTRNNKRLLEIRHEIDQKLIKSFNLLRSDEFHDGLKSNQLNEIAEKCSIYADAKDRLKCIYEEKKEILGWSNWEEKPRILSIGHDDILILGKEEANEYMSGVRTLIAQTPEEVDWMIYDFNKDLSRGLNRQQLESMLNQCSSSTPGRKRLDCIIDFHKKNSNNPKLNPNSI